MLSGPTSPLEGSPTTLGPPPWKYISSSRFVTPYTKPGIFSSSRIWSYKPKNNISTFKIPGRLGWAHTTKSSRAFLPSGVSVVISDSYNTRKCSVKGRYNESGSNLGLIKEVPNVIRQRLVRQWLTDATSKLGCDRRHCHANAGISMQIVLVAYL